MDFEKYVIEAAKTESNDWEKIQARITDRQTLRLLHAIVGVSSEISELVEAYRGSNSQETRTEIIEELGDICWFTALGGSALRAIGIKNHESDSEVFEDFPPFDISTPIDAAFPIDAALFMMQENAADLQTAIKAKIFYGREIITDNLFGRFQIIAALTKILAFKLDLSLKQIMDANIQKLQNKHKGRYKKGFDENAANTRDTALEMEAVEDALGGCHD